MTLRDASSLAIPRRFLRGTYTRSALAIVALMCGVALVCAMDLVNRAVMSAFTEVVDTMAGRTALTITAGGAPFPESVIERVADVPGIELAVPVVSATAFTVDGTGDLLTVHGVDITNDSAIRAYEAHDVAELGIENTLEFLNQGDSIVATKLFAANRGLHIGDSLELLTPIGRRTFTVRGLLEPRGIARIYGGNLIVMDLPSAQKTFLQPDHVNRIDIVVRPDARIADVQRELEQRLPSGTRVELPSQRKADLHRIMESLRLMLFALSFIGLAAALLIILNRLTTLFETRAWQLGVLRAVGMRAGRLWVELLKEAFLLGLIGVALGVPLGIYAGRLLLPVVAGTAALNFKLVATEAQLAITTPSLVLALVLGLGTAVLAAALPAWRIARRPPIETIRARGIAPPLRASSRSVLLPATIGGIALAVAVQTYTHEPTWGFVATALIVVAAVLSARPLLEYVSPSLLRGLRVLAGPSVNIARGTFARNSGRAVLTIAMVGVGIGAIIWLRTLAYSFETSLIHALSAALQGNWVVTSAHITQGYLEAPIDDEIVTEIRQIEGVAGAMAERTIDWQYANGPIAIDTFDAGYFADAGFGRWPIIGSYDANIWDLLVAGRAVLVSSNFALSVGVGAGDYLELDTPQGHLSVHIAGVTINFSSPRGTIVMPRNLYKQYWGDPMVNRVYVRTAEHVDPLLVRVAIAKELGIKYGLRILSSKELVDYFAAQVRRAFAPVDVLAALLLFVLLVGLADTLAASVLERMQEFAISRTLGARRSLLRRAVIVEGVSLGIPGLILAILSGFALAVLWVKQTFPFLLGWSLETHIPVAQVVFVCAVTLSVCWAAGLIPGRRAGLLKPADALRYE